MLAVSTGAAPGAPRFSRLVDPLKQSLNPYAQGAHGLQLAQLRRDGRPWPAVATEFVRWILSECLRSHPGGCRPVFIGHNVERWACGARCCQLTMWRGATGCAALHS